MSDTQKEARSLGSRKVTFLLITLIAVSLFGAYLAMRLFGSASLENVDEAQSFTCKVNGAEYRDAKLILNVADKFLDMNGDWRLDVVVHVKRSDPFEMEAVHEGVGVARATALIKSDGNQLRITGYIGDSGFSGTCTSP